MKRIVLMYLAVLLIAVIGCGKGNEGAKTDDLQKQMNQIKDEQNKSETDKMRDELERLKKEKEKAELERQLAETKKEVEAKKDEVSNPVVINENMVLKDGEKRAFIMEPGKYDIEMTASDDGASLMFLGADDNQKVYEKKQWSGMRKYNQNGQLIIENETTFGMGATCTATLKVTRNEGK